MHQNTSFLIKIAVILSCCSVATLAKNKYNVSMIELATCKDYDLRNTGYGYADFFHVHTLDNNKINIGELLHLKFYVLTSMDAHILLSVTDHPRQSDDVYEIVIGAGGNTFSTIRTRMGRHRVATNQDDRILSIMDPTPIEVIQMKDGSLLIYIPGFKNEPLLNYTDPSPLNIKYVSFSTFGQTSALWFYDCKFDGFDNEIEKEQRFLSPRDQLLGNLTLWSENASLPFNLSAVEFTFQIHAVSYQHETSLLSTRLNLILGYEDKRLAWDPYDFNGIDAVFESELDVWKPTLTVLNTVFPKLIKYQLKVQSNGSVLLIARDIEINTWCLNPNKNWPNEKIDCEIAMGLIEFDDFGAIDQISLEYTKIIPLPQEDEIAAYSEWSFERISVAKFAQGNLARFTPKGTLQTMNGDIAIEIVISRNRNFYRAVFTMPVLTAHSLLMMSFFLRGYRRGALTLVVFLILSLGLMYLTRHATPAYVPSIMCAYQINMLISVYCYLLHIAIMWLELYPPKNRPATCVMSMVNSSPLRLVLCMRFSDSTDYVDIQEYPWREVAKMLNNLSFFALLLILAILNLILVPQF